MLRCPPIALALALCALAPVLALSQPPAAYLGPEETGHLVAALHDMNMTPEDLRFAKDHGEPIFVLENVRRLLDQPLGLPPLARRCRDTLAARDAEAVWALTADLLETEFAPVAAAPDWDLPMPWDWLNPLLAETITHFVWAAQRADGLLTRAFAGVSTEDMEYAAGRELGNLFNIEDFAPARDALAASGVSRQSIGSLIEESRALDPEPGARAFLGIVERADRAALLEAGQLFQQAVSRLAGVLAEFDAWPESPVRLSTPSGEVFIGSLGRDVYEEPALLILDPGGDDVYTSAAGSANGLQGARLAAIVDLSGADTYTGTGLLGPATALWGLAVVLDTAGNDTHRAAYAGQGAAVFGCAWLEDRSGDDTYRAYGLAQGAAVLGLGLLRDTAGSDRYEVGLCGQAFAGVGGVGLLADHDGHDVYLAGGREPDHERHDDRFLSLAQGMAIGMRPFAGGGVAALVDLNGNDVYIADVFGQGVGYWYAVGMLVDAAGHDVYTVHHYGQGSGIHLSLGLLADEAGNDTYDGAILCQGNAHDYGVGMLLEGGGDDTYTGDQHAQGRALNNGLALLVDAAGDDAYFARQPDQAQGIGNDGGKREYGSLAVLMDLGGRDRYSCGAEDGARLLRPDFGIVYDVKEESSDED